ncbi:MAG: hypothetical protein ACO2OS_03540 [Thermosphaera aggregans]|uniref:hypothetical protein n=1 Tax=Thermosphaera aggregans TaxID=54254 RepID=UPI003BFA8C74
MEGTGTWRDIGDKYMNYYRGILRIYESFPEGLALCSAMASKWAKEVDRLKNEYHAFKEKLPQLTPMNRGTRGGASLMRTGAMGGGGLLWV